MNTQKLILESIKTKLEILKDKEKLRLIQNIGEHCVKTLRNGNKILIAGNGGSAADAQHFAAELAGKFTRSDRKPLPAIALTTNTSIITAIGNDFGYDKVFTKQIEALSRKGDVFFGISTSGNSDNLVKAAGYAKNKGLTTIGLLGNNGGRLKEFCDFSFVVPTDNTQNIQEAHIMLIHIICQFIDDAF